MPLTKEEADKLKALVDELTEKPAEEKPAEEATTG